MADVTRTPRTYRQTVRAQGVTRARERELEATAELLVREGPQALTLARAATAAGTTVPTLLRHFGAKDRLQAEALDLAVVRVRQARPRVGPGDARGAARLLSAEYEEHASLLRAAGQAALAGSEPARLEAARRLHRDWIARTFSRTLSPLLPVVHRVRLAQLAALSSDAAWRALRDAEQLSAVQAQAALASTLRALAA